MACAQRPYELGPVCVDGLRDADPVIALPKERAIAVGLRRPALWRRVGPRVGHARVPMCAQAIREPKQLCMCLRGRRGRGRRLHWQQVPAGRLGGLERGGGWVDSRDILEIEVIGEVRYPVRAHAAREIQCALLGLGLVRIGLAAGAGRAGRAGTARGDDRRSCDRGCHGDCGSRCRRPWPPWFIGARLRALHCEPLIGDHERGDLTCCCGVKLLPGAAGASARFVLVTLVSSRSRRRGGVVGAPSGSCRNLRSS